MTTTVLILAAGEHTRWKENYPKHLANVDGKPLIVRTCEQVLGISKGLLYPIVVTHNDEVRQEVYPHYVTQEVRDCLASTLWSNINHWADEVVVLLGDVFFSDVALGFIILPDESNYVKFYGTHHDLFAVRFKREHYKEFQAAIEAAMDYADETKDPNNGKLWNVYRAYCGQPLHLHLVERKHLITIDDITMDIDTVEDYIRLMDCLRWEND